MEVDRRVCIYPCYINKVLKTSEGRKLPKSAACENPTTAEMFDCIVQGLKLPAEREKKMHPRDWKYPGRVRVQLKDDSGKLINPDITNRRALMVKVAELVARHPGRTGKGAGAGPSGSGGGGGAGGSKKSGKKKK